MPNVPESARSPVVRARIPQPMLTRLTTLLSRTGESCSDYLRGLIRRDLERVGLWPPEGR
jgi:predicted DNA-binding protein